MSSRVLPKSARTTRVERRLTYADLQATMPESNQPCELWDGEIVMSPSPSFRHQEIVFRFHRALHDWVASRRLGKVVAAPIDMVLSPHRATQPDVAYIAKDRLQIIERVIMGPADLVAEVVSLEGRARDRIEKRDLYEQHGIKEYWIIDPEAQTVEALFLERATYQVLTRAKPSELVYSKLLPGFQVSVNELFSEG